MKKKVLFILPPIVLAIITYIWLFYKSGRWYSYRDELMYLPLFYMHIIMPIIYLIALIRYIVKSTENTNPKISYLFHIIASIIIMVWGFFGFFAFIIFTSGM